MRKHTKNIFDLKTLMFDCSSVHDAHRYLTAKKELAHYTGCTLDYGADIFRTILDEKMVTVKEPKRPDDVNDPMANAKWEVEVETFFERREKLKLDMERAYWLILDHCTQDMKGKLRSLSNWESIHDNSDLIALLKAIKSFMYGSHGHKDPYMSLFEAQRVFYKMHQRKDESDSAYLERFRNQVDVVEYLGGDFGTDKKLFSLELMEMEVPENSQASKDQLQKVHDIARQKYLATCFLATVDPSRHGKLVIDLHNDFVKKQNNYPNSLTEAFHLVVNYK